MANIAIRLVIAIATFFFLYKQLVINYGIESFVEYFNNITWGITETGSLAIALLLLPVNILLESYRWKYLIDKLEKVSFYNSIKAVLAGLSISLIMPNRVGDYLGRVFVLKKADRLQAVLSTILGSIAQLITTIIIGAIGVIFYFPEYFNITSSLNLWLYIGIIMGIMIAIFVIILSYLNFSVFSIIIKKLSGKYYSKIQKYSEVFSWYSQKELAIVLLLSVTRYMIFSTQFYFLLVFFGVNVNYFEALMLISVVYLSMAIIPTIALTEIGVRGSVSLFVFQQHFELHNVWSSQVSYGVVSASSLLWLMNIIFPAVLGAIAVFTLRFFRKINVY